MYYTFGDSILCESLNGALREMGYSFIQKVNLINYLNLLVDGKNHDGFAKKYI